MKPRPTFDPWPDKDFVFHGHSRRSRYNWMPLLVTVILAAGVGVSAIVWLTA